MLVLRRTSRYTVHAAESTGVNSASTIYYLGVYPQRDPQYLTFVLLIWLNYTVTNGF